MVFETKPVRITELAKETEQYLLQKGCKKSTLGVYKATWHKFMAFSSSDVYSRTAAEDFLKLYFGVDVHLAIQKLDSRMRHALRHMNALEDYLNTGAVPRKRMRGHYSTVPGLYEMFFGDYLRFCAQQYYSDSWFSTTRSALRLFLLAVNRHGIRNTTEINQETIGLYSDLLFGNNELCQNTKRHHSKCVSIYLRWLFEHGKISENFSCLLPDIKRTPSPLPDVWEETDVQKLLDVIDTASPIGKRNYAIFLLLARTGLRISDVILLRFENISVLLKQPNPMILHELRDLALMSLLYDTGARVQELVDLTLGDIRLTHPAMVILTGKGQKSRQIPLMKETCRLMDRYISRFHPPKAPKETPLFYNRDKKPLTRYGVTYILKKYAKKADAALNSKIISPHVLRHTKAMHLLRAGVNMIYIRDFLGHVEITTTEVYARIDAEMKRKVFEETVPNYIPEAVMPWEEDEDLLEWLTHFGKKAF